MINHIRTLLVNPDPGSLDYIGFYVDPLFNEMKIPTGLDRAIKNIFGETAVSRSRAVSIMLDALYSSDLKLYVDMFDARTTVSSFSDRENDPYVLSCSERESDILKNVLDNAMSCDPNIVFSKTRNHNFNSALRNLYLIYTQCPEYLLRSLSVIMALVFKVEDARTNNAG